MTHFRLALLTPRYDKQDNIANFFEDTISEFFSQEDSYESKHSSLLKVTDAHINQNISFPLDFGDSVAQDSTEKALIVEPNINEKKNTFCYTYNEKLSLSENAQKTLTFDLDKNLMIENEWKENPFARLITIGSQLLLIDSFNNEYIFTVKNIKYNFKEINATYNITCEDSFTYQTIRQNSGYTLDNDASSDDFIGALNIDEWTSNYIIKDCHLSYSYISLETGIYETQGNQIFTYKYGDILTNVKRIIKEPYRPALRNLQGDIIEERDNLYFETFPFSCSNSNANAALISLAESLGLQIKTLEHSIYKKDKRTNRFILYFWFEPQKNDRRLGLTYTPEDSIQSFTLTHAGDSLTTVLNVEGPEYDSEIITLIPDVPNIFLDLFNSEEWKNSGYAPGFFSSYCTGREYSENSKNLNYEIITEDSNKFIVLYTSTITDNSDNEIKIFNFPSLFGKVKFRTNLDSTVWSQNNSTIMPQTHHIFLKLKTYDNLDTKDDAIIYEVYENEELPKLKTYTECKIQVEADATAITVSQIVLYFYRDVTAEERDFAEMADKCPWLENKIIDFNYFLDSNIISKNEYNSLMNILQNDLRIVNGQLMFYAQSYYSALHKRTQELSQLTSNLDLLGANCEASIITPLTNKGVIDNSYVEDFKQLYNDVMSSVNNPTKKIALLGYDDLVTNYLNKYINAQQRFLKNIYNFSNYFYSINSFSEKELYPYSLQMTQTWNPSYQDLQWNNNQAISTVNWYGFDRTNYALIDSSFKFYSGYGEDNAPDSKLSLNYGMPLVSIFKKDIQQNYLYDAKNEIVYNNPDNYKQFYIRNETKANTAFLIGDGGQGHQNIKYDEDRDFYLLRGWASTQGQSLYGRTRRRKNNMSLLYIDGFENHFDIDKNKDYTTWKLSTGKEFVYMSYTIIVGDSTITTNYLPSKISSNWYFTSWANNKAYSEPIRVSKFDESTELGDPIQSYLYKASLTDLKKTFWDNHESEKTHYFVKETNYYEPINVIEPPTSSDPWNIDYHIAYDNLRLFAKKALLYRTTPIETFWQIISDLDESNSPRGSVTAKDYNIYLKYLPIDNIYIKTYKTSFDSVNGDFKIFNKEGKDARDFVNSWNSFFNNTETSIAKRTGNPYAFKPYQPISFVNETNKDTFFRNVTPNLWKPVLGSCVATFVVLPFAIAPAVLAASVLTASMWIWYYSAYSPGNEGANYYDFYGDNDQSGVKWFDNDDIRESSWNRWHHVTTDSGDEYDVPFEHFFKTANSFVEYKQNYNIKNSGSFIFNYYVEQGGSIVQPTYTIGSLVANLAGDTSERNMAGYWRAYSGYTTNYVLVPWSYETLWNKIGITTGIIEKWLCSTANRQLIGNLYLSNPHFLKPIVPKAHTIDYTTIPADTIKKGKTYKLFIIDDIAIKGRENNYQNFNNFLVNNSLINSVWYYPIYKQLHPVDLSQIDFNTTTFDQLQNLEMIETEKPSGWTGSYKRYIFSMTNNAEGKTVKAVLFEEIDYKLTSVSELEEITGTETYYDSDGQIQDITKRDDFTEGCWVYPQLEDCLEHPQSFSKDKTYYMDNKGQKRAYTIYQIKNSKNSRWEYGYLNNNTYNWDEFRRYIDKTSVPIVKNEIQLLWTRPDELSTPTYKIKSINSNFLPIYKELIFDWENNDTTNTSINIDDDQINFTCTCDVNNKIDLSHLTNGYFWYKYHDDLGHQLLQQYAIAVECKLTEYWNSAYTNSKYCEYFIPESWKSIENYSNNYFANRIVLRGLNSVSLNIEFVPTVKIFADNKQKTIFKRYYYKYISSTPEPEDLYNAGDQETIQQNLRSNVAIQNIFTNLEDISLDNIICTEQENTSYYYVQNGGKTWKDFIYQVTNLSLDYFSGLYEMTLTKILKSYKPLPMTEYYRLKKIHDDIWSGQLYQHFGSLILENNYKDTLSTTSQELYNAAVNAFRDYAAPERQYNLTLIDVAQLKGYTGQDLRVGDAIRIDANMYYNEYDQIYNSLSQYLFITDINYNLRNVTDINITVNSIKYQDKLLQKLVKLIK